MTEAVRLTETRSLLIFRGHGLFDYFPKYHSPQSYNHFLYVIWVSSTAAVSHIMLARSSVRRAVAAEDLSYESGRDPVSVIFFVE